MELIKPEAVSITAQRPFGVEPVYSQAPEGLSISEILWNGAMPERLPYTLEVWVDGRFIPAVDYSTFRPPAGSLLVINTLPKNGQGGALRAILGIVIIAVAAYTGQVYGAQFGAALGFSSTTTAGAVGGALITASIGTVGMLAVNALVPPQTPSLTTPAADIQEAPTLWISGAKNQINLWGTVPVVLGRNRTVPFYGAKPYTEIAGNDQYFRGLYVVGYGPLQIEDIRIGETPISDFDDVEVEVRSGYPTDLPVTLVPDSVHEEDLAITLLNDWETQTTEADIDEFSVDYCFLQGLCEINTTSGRRSDLTVQLDGRYRKVGEETWLSFAEDIVTHEKQFDVQPCFGLSLVGIEYVTAPFYRQDRIVVDPSGNILLLQSAGKQESGPESPPGIPPGCSSVATLLIYGNDVTITDTRTDPPITGMETTLVSELRVQVAAGAYYFASRLITTANTGQPLRKTLKIKVPERGQYEVNLKRLTEIRSETSVTDICTWTVLRSIQNEYPISFTHPLSIIAVRAKATDELNGPIDELNCVATSIVWDWDPTLQDWVHRPSSNPASLYMHVLRGNANARGVDGPGAQWLHPVTGLPYNAS